MTEDIETLVRQHQLASEEPQATFCIEVTAGAEYGRAP